MKIEKNIHAILDAITNATMNRLTQEQLTSIKNYWKNHRSLESELETLDFRMHTIFIYGTESDDIEKMVNEVEGEMNDVRRKIQQLEENYEVMLNGYGIYLCDRSMDEDLFAFINDGPE